jgi:hypothetical protein
MISKTIVALLFAATLGATAAPRAWKSADGQRSVKGEFVSRNAKAVTIRRSADFRDVAIPLDQLFPEDLTWLNANHPLPGTAPVPALPTLLFEPLITFGESRAQVLAKLKTNKDFKATIAETLMGRTGLNGVYRTREKIGGPNASLYFDWDESGNLKEVTLQTEPLPASNLKEQLLPCWTTLITLLTTQYGEPLVAQKNLDLAPIQEGSLSSTHIWKLKGSGTAMLGAARDGNQYLIAVCFSTQEPKVIPAPAKPAP